MPLGIRDMLFRFPAANERLPELPSGNGANGVVSDTTSGTSLGSTLGVELAFLGGGGFLSVGFLMKYMTNPTITKNNKPNDTNCVEPKFLFFLTFLAIVTSNSLQHQKDFFFEWVILF
jgi:hypothetical protein